MVRGRRIFWWCFGINICLAAAAHDSTSFLKFISKSSCYRSCSLGCCTLCMHEAVRAHTMLIAYSGRIDISISAFFFFFLLSFLTLHFFFFFFSFFQYIWTLKYITDPGQKTKALCTLVVTILPALKNNTSILSSSFFFLSSLHEIKMPFCRSRNKT